ncbi:MAG: hypothetical protein E8D49_07805 [Nitrospira sp.]|nr:MAG: hypothetical protein E8D49_07805 [Nitrospira sp.]
MKNLLSRLQFWKAALWGFGVKILIPIWGILQVLSFIRGEFFPRYNEQYPIIAIIPQLPWWGWVIAWLTIFLVVFLEGGYRIYIAKQGEAEELRLRLAAIQTPTLVLEYREGDNRYLTPMPGDSGIRKSFALVSVYNPSLETIEEVEISCEDVIPTESADENLPLGVIGDRQPFTLHPGQREFKRMVAHVLDDTVRPGIFEVLLRSPVKLSDSQTGRLMGRVFLMKVRARARNTPEVRFMLRFGLRNGIFFANREE